MSDLTEITLVYGCLDDARIHEFNDHLAAAGLEFRHGIPRLMDLGRALADLPGAKVFTNMVAAACWNNAGSERAQLVRGLRSFPWEDPDDVVLVIASEQAPAQVFRPTDAEY